VKKGDNVKTTIRIFCLTLVVVMLSPGLCYGQDKREGIMAGEKVKIFSKAINEERDILISLPYGYGQSKQRFPVMYFTDGTDFALLASGGLVRYLSYWQIPQMITVYIPNMSHATRVRDLSIGLKPMEKPGSMDRSGYDNFLKFLTAELIAYIDSNYRTTDYRILVGSSLGGYFTYHALLSAPDFFDAYIAVSPHIRDYLEKDLQDETKDFFQNHAALNKFLFVAYYEKDYKTTSLAYPKIDDIIRGNLPAGFRYRVKTYPGQAHVPKTALLDGLELLFQDWQHIKTPEFCPNAGLLKHGSPIIVEIKGYDSSIRYTLNGSEPTGESALYAAPIAIADPTTIKAKSFRGNLGESDVATAEYKAGADPIGDKRTGNFKPGIKFGYMEKVLMTAPDSLDMTEAIKGVVGKFSIGSRTRDEGFVFQFDGFIHIAKKGRYCFHVLSTVPAKLFIGQLKLIDYSFSKSGGDPLYTREEYGYSIFLKPGHYPIRCIYSNPYHNGDDFTVSYEGPGIAKQEIPANVLFHSASH
jgi:predicted alpha/beta superfamily hydrolase